LLGTSTFVTKSVLRTPMPNPAKKVTTPFLSSAMSGKGRKCLIMVCVRRDMAWEKRKGPFLVIGMLHKEICDTNMIYSALSLDRPGWNTLVLFESGRPYDVARNNIATRALDVGAEWCFYWDSDMVIPPNTLTRLTSHELMIVGGLYDRRHPEIWPEIFRDAGGGVLDPIPRSQIPEPSALPQGLMEVDGIGAGCLLVHRRVFEFLKEKVPLRTFSVRGPPPGEIKFYEFFRWGVGRDPGSEGPSYSEDLTFSVLARKHGFKIFCDTFVKPMHLAPMAIKDGKVTWTPLEGGGV